MKNLVTFIGRFTKEVLTELKKVTWPSKNEVVGSTIIVCVLVIVFAAILGAMDGTFSSFIRKLI